MGIPQLKITQSIDNSIFDRNFVPSSRKRNEHGSWPVVRLVADVCLIGRKSCQRRPDSLLSTIRYWVLNCSGTDHPPKLVRETYISHDTTQFVGSWCKRKPNINCICEYPLNTPNNSKVMLNDFSKTSENLFCETTDDRSYTENIWYGTYPL